MRYTARALRALAAATMALALLAPAAPAAVGVGHSGWYWGNPRPQGITLGAVDFTGPRGYAVGEFGVALRSDDGGTTWSGLSTATTSPLERVQAATADTVFAGGGCELHRSRNGGRSFDRLTFAPGCDRRLAAFAFPTPNAGYVLLSDGAVLATTDGGDTFSRRTPLPGAAPGGPQDAEDVAVTPAGHVLVATAGRVPGAGGTLQRSADGAATWSQAGGAPVGLRGVTVVDATTAYAVGDESTVLKSTDGGETWAPAEGTVPGPGRRLSAIRCRDASTCVASTADGSAIVRTSDGGASFTVITAATPIPGLDFAAGARVVGVGHRGATVVSDDDGARFALVGGFTADQFRRLRPGPGGPVAFALGGDGALARTNDAGRTWQRVGASTAAAIRDVSFATQETGFVLAEDGGLLRTDNGGASYRILDPGSGVARAVLALDARQVLLVGPRGVRRSGDGGATFVRVTDPVAARAAVESGEVVGGAAFAWGARTLIASTDGGRRWAAVRLPRRKVGLRDVDFVSASVGWVLDSGGRLFLTRDRGRTWTESVATGPGGNDPYAIAFSSLARGFLLTRSAGLLATQDGGASWRPQRVARELLDDVVALGGEAAVGLVAPGELYGTDTGGRHAAGSSLSLRTSTPRLGRKGGRVTLRGRLAPPEGREAITVAARVNGRWTRRVVEAASDGTFSLQWRVTRTTAFVAQWAGDDVRTGAGSRALTVAVEGR